MEIHGFQKLTLLDYPEHIAATVFTGGCNFRCPFCQNGDLVVNPAGQPLISEAEVFATLRKRRGVLQGVCITGGEPTLQKDLREFILKVKELGYLVKLDTNGYRPEVLGSLLEENLLDYVAMDVKASLENYTKAAGCPGLDIEKIQRSIALLKGSKIPYEFRTTVVKGLHTVEEFEKVGEMLVGAKAYYLQGYQESEAVLGLSRGLDVGKEERLERGVTKRLALEMEPEKEILLGAFSREEMEQIADIARKYVSRAELRGVE